MDYDKLRIQCTTVVVIDIVFQLRDEMDILNFINQYLVRKWLCWLETREMLWTFDAVVNSINVAETFMSC